MTIGAFTCGRTFAIIASDARRLPPAAIARSVARWITGPSASGSENGTPTSRTSAPARSSALRISAERGRSGSPAVVYVTSPGRFSARSRANVFAIRLLSGKSLLHRLHVLVAAPGQIHEQHCRRPELACDAHRVGDRVRRLERGQNALEPRERLKRR